jgi:hypothetical protein
MNLGRHLLNFCLFVDSGPPENAGDAIRRRQQGLIELKLLAFALYFADGEINDFVGCFEHGIGLNLALRLFVVWEAHSQ